MKKRLLCSYIIFIGVNYLLNAQHLAPLHKGSIPFPKKLSGKLITPPQGSKPAGHTSLTESREENQAGNAQRGGNNQVAALTLRTWNGSVNNTFNTAGNWTPNGVPSATDSCVIILSATKTISLNASCTVGALYVSLGTNGRVLTIDAGSRTLAINGTTTLRTTSGNANTLLLVNVDNGGTIEYRGDLNCNSFSSNKGLIYPVLGLGGTTGTVIMKGDVTYSNAVVSSSADLPGTLIFDAAGTQSINNVSSLYLNPWPASIFIGSSNTPTVTITGQQATWFATGDVTVKANASLILPGGATSQDGGTLASWNGSGGFTLNSGSVLKLGADQGDYGAGAGAYNGVAGSNFPGSFASYSFNSASTVEYNSGNGVSQTIYNSPVYGNLTITNSSGSGSSTKTAGGNLTMNGSVTINSLATFAGSSFTHQVKGDWTNAGSYSSGTSTVNFNGTSAQSISGSSSTGFANLTISNSTANVSLSQNISISANFTNNGLFAAGTMAVTFNGSAAQMISGTSSTAFYDLVMNNTGGNVTLSQAASVSHALTLTSGKLNTTSVNILTMLNGSSAPALTSASTSYVSGPLRYQKSVAGSTALNFPIGKGSDCRPVILTVNHLDATLFNYTGESFNANPWTAFGSGANDMPSTVDTISQVHYVTIDRTDNGGVSQPTSKLVGNQTIEMFFGTNDFVYEGANLTIVKNTSAAPATWIDIGGSCALGNFAAPQAGSVSSTSSPSAFNSFSTFALGSKIAGWNSLPVELLSFSARPDKNKVDLGWTTATETNNKNFTVERSADASNFEPIAIVETKAPGGNSLQQLKYATSDADPLPGVSYYRLKQTDKDGKYRYHQVISVELTSDKKVTFSIYPNPNSGEFTVDFSGIENNHEITITLYDADGRVAHVSSVFSNSINTNQVSIVPQNKLAKGVYRCAFEFEGIRHYISVIIE